MAFREMRRKKRAISDEEARALLASERRGVLAVNGEDGYPFAFPINYLYDEADGKIIFHGAKSGLKVDSLRRCDKVCFTVMGNESVEAGEEWAPYVSSCVVYGRCKMIDDVDTAAALVRRLALKYYPSADLADAEIAKSINGMYLYVIEIEHFTGKRVQEK